jgi:hypothetical protein
MEGVVVAFLPHSGRAELSFTAHNFLTHPLADIFHPPDPPIASQSISRDVPVARARAFRFTISLFREWPRLPFTARIGRAPFHRARSASKEGTWPLPPHPSEAARCASTKDTRLSRLHPRLPEHLSRIRSLRLGDFFRRPFRHNLAPAIATLRPKVDNPIGILDHVEIMLDHHHGIAGFD